MSSRRGEGESGRRGKKQPRRRVRSARRNAVPLTPALAVTTSPDSAHSIITLLTDFGAADYFVGAMRGAILSVNPDACIVDISHEIPPGDIGEGAFNLLAAYESFPARTIHVAVVDPGVGSPRRPIVAVTAGQFFIGPDNGIFSYIIERERAARVFHLTNDSYFRHPVSRTFHGRDVFAPAAGALSRGVGPEVLGPEIEDYVRLAPLAPKMQRDGSIVGLITHVDHFGNCITNLTPTELTPEMIEGGARLSINRKEISKFRHFFSEAGNSSELFALWGSAGFLEIAANSRSAAKLLKAKRGQPVAVSIPKRTNR